MPPRTMYSGALPSKKKAELQDLATALHLSDQGTKEDIQVRIKKHLDLHQAALEENPVFAGLFGRRRKGSVQPVSQAAPPSKAEPDTKPLSTASAKSDKLDAVREEYPETPFKDLGDVSQYLKHPISPDSTPDPTPIRPLSLARQAQAPTSPRSPPVLPPSSPTPSHSALTRAAPVSLAPPPPAITSVISNQDAVVNNSIETFVAFREFLSNSRNIWSLTAVAELLYVYYAVIPWQQYDVIVSSAKPASTLLSIYYPPLETFTTSAFWIILLHWALPTLIIPAVVGTIISFNPTPAPPQSDGEIEPSAPIAPFDPLTASIVRLALQIAYPYPTIESSSPSILLSSSSTLSSLITGSYESAIRYGIPLDVIGFRVRVLNAGIGLAFAFAEEIAKAPERFAESVAKLRLVGDSANGNSSGSGAEVQQRRGGGAAKLGKSTMSLRTENTLFEEAED